jgi:predicted  nucleic acid-binding Zn-ribbon protein
MLPEVENFIGLQQADGEIRRLQEEIAALPKRVAAIEEKLAGTKTRLEAAKAAVKADEASRRKHESAIQDLQQKISKYRDQSLAVKTNDQYKALLHEIQFAEQEIKGNEDKILELMVNTESREKGVKAAEAEMKAETAEIEKEKIAARERTAQDEKELVEWNAKRDRARGGVDSDLLRHYDRVFKFRGSGLAEVRDQKCTGCSVKLRPQTYNEVRSGTKTIVCDSCQRILYYDPAKEAVAETASVARRRRAKPKDKDQAWFYNPNYGEYGEVLLSFIQTDFRWRRRTYDAQTGREVGDSVSAEGDYRKAFAADLGGAVQLNGYWNASEIKDWGGELPSIVMDLLNRDLDLARAELGAAAPTPSNDETPTPERSVAS